MHFYVEDILQTCLKYMLFSDLFCQHFIDSWAVNSSIQHTKHLNLNTDINFTCVKCFLCIPNSVIRPKQRHAKMSKIITCKTPCSVVKSRKEKLGIVKTKLKITSKRGKTTIGTIYICFNLLLKSTRKKIFYGESGKFVKGLCFDREWSWLIVILHGGSFSMTYLCWTLPLSWGNGNPPE